MYTPFYSYTHIYIYIYKCIHIYIYICIYKTHTRTHKIIISELESFSDIPLEKLLIIFLDIPLQLDIPYNGVFHWRNHWTFHWK